MLANTDWVDSENKNIRTWNRLLKQLKNWEYLPQNHLSVAPLEGAPVLRTSEVAKGPDRLNNQTVDAWTMYLHVRLAWAPAVD